MARLGLVSRRVGVIPTAYSGATKVWLFPRISSRRHVTSNFLTTYYIFSSYGRQRQSTYKNSKLRVFALQEGKDRN